MNPGLYRLRLSLPSGACQEHTLVACAGWQTQVFLLQRDHEGARLADLPKASVLMALGKGFQTGDAGLRQAELARLGLMNERKVLSSDVREMLEGKFANPMLGIYGAHLLLLENSPDLRLVRIVVNNLRSLLGDSHPDVEALALAVNGSPASSFAVPPMLRRSWKLVVDATLERPDLVPADSVAARAAQNVCSEEPWFVWTTSTQTSGDPRTDWESGLRSYLSPWWLRASLSDSPFPAVRKMFAAAEAARLAKAAPLWLPQPAAPDSSPLDETKMGFLVRTLGIPRSAVDNLLRATNLMKEASDADDADTRK